MSADHPRPLCVTTIVLSSPPPRRMANLSYIRNFCFSHSSKDELSYCLSTFEAAVEYINLGKLDDSPAVGVEHTHTHTHHTCLHTHTPACCLTL